MAIVDPDQPPLPDRLVVVKLRNGHAMIRRFIRHEAGRIYVERLAPEQQEIGIGLHMIESAHRIVGVGDAPAPEESR